MPEPLKADRRYMPGLDGLRAVAVLGVVAYHLGLTVFPGGFLGVSVFFTLSGYLISDLILSRSAAGEFTLKSFWQARARRLLPAMFLMLVALMAWVTLVGPAQGEDFRAASLTSALYVNNWWQVAREVSYFAQFQSPGVLNHLWSLAVEEQFYIVWPLVLLVLARYVRERDNGPLRPRLAVSILGLAFASCILMAVLFDPSKDPTRVYYGTDTRAAELLVGAALAAVWPSARLRSAIRSGARNAVDALGAVGLLVIVVMFLTVHDRTSFLYRGGFALLSLAVACVVACVAHPASRLAPLLGTKPMQWVGARSYGIYLWHFPVIVLSTPSAGSGPHIIRTPLQLLVSFCLASLSWRFLEDPIRHGALGRAWARWTGPQRPALGQLGPAQVGALGFVIVLLLPAVAGYAGVGTRHDSDAVGMDANIEQTVTGDPTPNTEPSGAPSETDATDITNGSVDTTPATEPMVDDTTTNTNTNTNTTAKTVDAMLPRPGKTSCTEIIHIGDSTSTGLITKKYLAVADQISAQYRRVGVTVQHFEIAGGRSINEGYKKARPAKRSAEKWKKKGYRGCWVLALGTMDAAAVGKGIRPGIAARIKMMTDIVGDDPVMWVNLRGKRTSGPWGAASLAAWNKELLLTCESFPNMRIYDWASDVQTNWYISDGIHQNSKGYKYRAQFIADALAQAFPEAPAATPSNSCLVRL